MKKIIDIKKIISKESNINPAMKKRRLRSRMPVEMITVGTLGTRPVSMQVARTGIPKITETNNEVVESDPNKKSGRFSFKRVSIE